MVALRADVVRGLEYLPGALLLLQFPVLHSYLLSRRGYPLLRKLSPVGHGRTLSISSFAMFGSLQLLVTFWLWSPSDIVWHRPEGLLGGLWELPGGELTPGERPRP